MTFRATTLFYFLISTGGDSLFAQSTVFQVLHLGHLRRRFPLGNLGNSLASLTPTKRSSED